MAIQHRQQRHQGGVALVWPRPRDNALDHRINAVKHQRVEQSNREDRHRSYAGHQNAAHRK